MTSLHLSWQVTVLRQHSTQQGSLNLPTICHSPKTSSVMSSPPCQSRWHIKFVSGNSVGDYILIQHRPEPMATIRQLLWDREDNVNVGRPHAIITNRIFFSGSFNFWYNCLCNMKEGWRLKRPRFWKGDRLEDQETLLINHRVMFSINLHSGKGNMEMVVSLILAKNAQHKVIKMFNIQ